MKKTHFILGIESSCDDTSAAVLEGTILRSNVTANQKIHEEYGGVVPELASRAHQQNIVPVVDAALSKAGISAHQLSAIAYTNGPGLLGSLLVGSSFAKGFSMGLNIPLIEVNHMKAHIQAHFIQRDNNTINHPSFPFICLTVSGGHTQLVLVNSHSEFEIIGETTDDAVGEAFDKIAKLLGLPYPGGPYIDRCAKMGDASKFKFPISKVDKFNFSYSGIKTAVLYFLEKGTKKDSNFIQNNMDDICASVQKALLDSLLIKLEKAAIEYGVKDLAIAGGVSANSGLREQLKELCNHNEWNAFIPDFQFCTDNAAMIAISGYFKFLENEFADLNAIPNSRMVI